MPHLARLMMNKLVQALFSQRAHLLDSQNAGTQRVVELEQRLIKAQQQVNIVSPPTSNALWNWSNSLLSESAKPTSCGAIIS